MTYQTATRDHAPASTTSTSPQHRLACVLAELEGDELVRPELHNAAILSARHAAQLKRLGASASQTPARRS